MYELTGTNPLDPTSVTPFEMMYRKYKLTPSIVLGKSLFTRQVTLLAGVTTLIIPATAAKFYVIIPGTTTERVFIGNRGITVSSGFGLPTNSPFDFAVTENTEVYAVAVNQTMIYIMDMGM